MPDEKLQYVIDIIRESADFGTEQEEIDIEIDKIDTVTQRKLQNFVLKVIYLLQNLRIFVSKFCCRTLTLFVVY